MALKLVAVDPPGCGCTDCLVGYSKPADELNLRQLIKLHFGKLENRTNGYETHLNVTLENVRTMPDGTHQGTVAVAGLSACYPNQAKVVHDVTEIMRQGDLLCCDAEGDCDCEDLP